VTLTDTDVPTQIVPSLEVVPDVSVYPIAGSGSGFTVTVSVAVAVHPFAAVAVTVYVVVVVGETVLEDEELESSHEYETPPEAFSVTLSPLQVVPSLFVLPDVSVTETDGVGGVHTPGTVETGVDSVLDNVLSKSQLHLVFTVIAFV